MAGYKGRGSILVPVKRFIIEETFAVHSTLEWIKRITVAFMQINQHI